MKLLFCVTFLLSTLFSNAQNYKLTLGDEMKMKRGVSDMKIIDADETGVFLAEGHPVKEYHFMGDQTYKTVYNLIRFDKNFNQVFSKEYDKEMKDYDYHSFRIIAGDLFLFATTFSKKEKTFKLYGVKLNKTSGDFIGDLTEIGSYNLESKKDDYDLRIEPINDGKSFLVVVDISNVDRTSLGISILSNKLVKQESTVINLSYQEDLYQLEGVWFTANKKIVLLGREFELLQTGSRKKKPVFTQYSMTVYDNKGRKEKSIDVSMKDKFVIGGKLIPEDNGNFMLAGLYSKNAKKETLDGFFLSSINMDKGEMVVASSKEINSSMLPDVVETDEEKKKRKKNEDDEGAFPNRYVIRTAEINPVDKSYIITAEISEHEYYVSSQKMSVPATIHSFINGNVLVIGADKNAQVKWMNMIPKKQVEEIIYYTTSAIGRNLDNYFTELGGKPFYSSYKSVIRNNQLILILNDHRSNNIREPKYGDKLKSLYFKVDPSDLYGVAINLADGKTLRKSITENNDYIMMPRLAFVVNNDVYIATRDTKAFGKTGFKMAKITIE